MSSYSLNLQDAADLYFCVPRDSTLESVQLVTAANFGTHGANYFTITVFGNDGATVLATHTNNSGASNGRYYTEGVPFAATLGNMQKGDFTSSQGAKVTCVKTGTGTIDGNLVVTFSDARKY